MAFPSPDYNPNRRQFTSNLLKSTGTGR